MVVCPFPPRGGWFETLLGGNLGLKKMPSNFFRFFGQICKIFLLAPGNHFCFLGPPNPAPRTHSVCTSLADVIQKNARRQKMQIKQNCEGGKHLKNALGHQ